MQCWFRHVRNPRAASIARTPSAHRTGAGYPQDSAPRNGADDHRGRRPMSSKLIWFRPTYVIDRDRLMVARKTRACCRRTAVTRSPRRFAACSKKRRPFAGRRPPVRSRHRRKMVAAPDVIETVHVPAAAERAVCTAAPLIASKLLLPLWWFAWRCPWRGGLRLGHWRRLGLGHRGGLGSHRLEWRRPRWLAWTRRVTRVWHGDSVLRNEDRRRGRRPDDLAELVVVFRVGQPPRWGEQQSGERRSPQHRSACPLSGSSLPLSRIPACGLLDRGRKRHTPLRSVIIQPERHQRGHRCGAGYLRPEWRLPSWRGMAPSTARSESRRGKARLRRWRRAGVSSF